jgi:hypothetical protein
MSPGESAATFHGPSLAKLAKLAARAVVEKASYKVFHYPEIQPWEGIFFHSRSIAKRGKLP